MLPRYLNTRHIAETRKLCTVCKRAASIFRNGPTGNEIAQTPSLTRERQYRYKISRALPPPSPSLYVVHLYIFVLLIIIEALSRARFPESLETVLLINKITRRHLTRSRPDRAILILLRVRAKVTKFAEFNSRLITFLHVIVFTSN